MTALAGWICSADRPRCSSAKIQKRNCHQPGVLTGELRRQAKEEKSPFSYCACLRMSKSRAQSKTGELENMQALLLYRGSSPVLSLQKPKQIARPSSPDQGIEVFQNSFNGNTINALNLILWNAVVVFNCHTLAGNTGSNLFCCRKFRHTIAFGITRDQRSGMPKTMTPASLLAQLPCRWQLRSSHLHAD